MRVKFLIDIAGDYYFYYVHNWELSFFPNVGDSLSLLSYMNEREIQKSETIRFYSEALKNEYSLYKLLEDDYRVLVKSRHWYNDYIEIELYIKSLEDKELKNIKGVINPDYLNV